MISAKMWQQSFSGQVIKPRDLRPEQVRFEDIGHALAQKIRFNGQCTVMGYTVAQHCVTGAMRLLKTSPKHALPFLLHEVDEVYLPDVPSPIKGALSVQLEDSTMISWHDLCGRHSTAIFEAIGLSHLRPLIDDPVVKHADVRMLLTEKRDLMGKEPQPWGFVEDPYPERIVDIWEPAWAEEQFNRAFKRLLHLRGGK